MKYTIVLDEQEEMMLSSYMKEHGFKYKSEACRALMILGKTTELEQEHLDKISHIVKEELDEALRGHNQRIKSILYKGGKLASYSTYLLVGALRELIPSSKKQNGQILYEKASKYAIGELKRKE